MSSLVFSSLKAKYVVDKKRETKEDDDAGYLKQTVCGTFS